MKTTEEKTSVEMNEKNIVENTLMEIEEKTSMETTANIGKKQAEDSCKHV